MTGPWLPSDADGRIPRLLHGVDRPGRLGRTGDQARALDEAPFVGREQLLQHIYELADVARSGHGVVVALSGEAGIGKTRLLREIAGRGPAIGFVVDWISGSRRFEELLDSVVGEATSLTDGLAEPPSTRMLQLRPLRRPRLVMIDDALLADHHADLAALAAVGVGRRSMLVLLGLSPELTGVTRETRQILAALARQRVLSKVTVPPLAEAELFEMATHLLGGRPDARL